MMDKLEIFGVIPFNSLKEKRKAVHKLKSEFGQNFSYTVDNSMIAYKSSVFQY
ncbi:hypothetical protein [Cytobacillus gottheilii]|uniref:hypothetical protein n=1 Tax=Cytobacillus gottheilii TaxID=859144 RepID=UPI001C59FB1F|nr:hypothetical protein [Cytobacillus gottheilii]